MRPRLPSTGQLLSRFTQIEEAGWYSNFGQQVREFESRLAQFVGVPSDNVISVANATLGIAGAVAVSRVRNWAVPSWTFTASVSGLMLGGGVPEFIDIERHSHWLDLPEGGEGAASSGVLVVAPFGLPIRPDLLARKTPTIIDAAASLGVSEGALSEISENVMVVYSLHATKVMGIGEGGFVVFGSAEHAERFRAWTNFGFTGSRESQFLGPNAKMSEFHAAIGHAVLDGWAEEKAEWLVGRRLVRSITNQLNLNTLDHPGDFVSPYWIVDFASLEERQDVERTLTLAGIATRRWWQDGCHRMPAYRGVQQAELVNTERVSNVSLGLPFFRGLADVGEDALVTAITDAIG
jgi:dTDP-4-amino-4,6-dideoxygalactose transaminase